MSGLLLIQFHRTHGAAALGRPGSGHPQDGPPCLKEAGRDTAQVEVAIQSCRAGPTVHSPVRDLSSGAAGRSGVHVHLRAPGATARSEVPEQACASGTVTRAGAYVQVLFPGGVARAGVRV